MDITSKIRDVSMMLDELDKYSDSLSGSLSEVDSKICDLMHLIEANSFKTNQCYRIVRELRKLRLERRKIKNDMDLMQIFRNEQNKLLSTEYRKFLMNSIYKESRKQTNAKYNNRIYTEEELNKMIGV